MPRGVTSNHLTQHKFRTLDLTFLYPSALAAEGSKGRETVIVRTPFELAAGTGWAGDPLRASLGQSHGLDPSRRSASATRTESSTIKEERGLRGGHPKSSQAAAPMRPAIEPPRFRACWAARSRENRSGSVSTKAAEAS
jgi:hypothetical protein